MKRKNVFSPGYILLVLLTLGLVLSACGDVTPTVPAAAATAATTGNATTTSATTTTTAATTTAPAIPTVTPTTAASTSASAATTNTSAATTTVATTAAATTSATTAAPATQPPARLNRIAYVDNGNLFTIDPATKAKQQVADSGKTGPVNELTISPASGLLVFSAGSGSANLWVSNLKDSPTKLVNDQPSGTSDTEPKFSPDGKTVLFTRVFDTSKDGKYDAKDKHELWLVDNNGANAHKLTDGQQGSWGSDGKRIAFVTDGKLNPEIGLPTDNALHLINAEGKNEWEPITGKKVPTDWNQVGYPFGTTVDFIQYPAFVDSGKKIAFSARGTGALFTINSLDGKDVKLWTGNPEGGFGKIWSAPGGSLMMFESFPPSGVVQVGFLNASANPTPAQQQGFNLGGPRENYAALLPAWSPDGKQVVFVRTSDYNMQHPVKGTLVVGTLKADGVTGLTELTAGTFSDVAWSY